MAVKSKYEKLQNKYVRKVDSLYSSGDGKELLDIIQGGHNTYLKFSRVQSSAIDFAWVKKIIETIPALGDIVQNPKKTIQTLTEVVQVEKVKKIGVETVAHLSSHTQYIKTVDENGNVTPSKLLNIYNDDFYAIYENKFVATLIRHLLIFVEKRYEILKNTDTTSSVNMLMVKNHTVIDDQTVDIETKVKFTHAADVEGNDKLRGFIKQVEDIRKYLKFYANSEFMRILRREKDVRNPILQTNIIRKNPKYRKCYQLWQFIERYRDSGLDLKVEEQFSNLNAAEIKEINEVMAANFLLLKAQDIKGKKNTREIKPKILNTYDDEIYRPEPNEGPIEFIRIDQKYRNYVETLHELNPHPTRSEAQFNLEKYRENKKRREQTKQVDSLLRRKEQEKAKFEKEEILRDEREKNRDLYVDQRAEKEIREEAIVRTEKVREALIEEAVHDQKVPPKEVEKPVQAVEQPVEEQEVEEARVDVRFVAPTEKEIQDNERFLKEKEEKKESE